MRKRSRYRPKPILQNPLGFVLENLTPVSRHDSYLVDLKIRNHAAMAALVQGQADQQDMYALVAMNNVVEALVRLGFGEQYREVMQAGYEAMLGVSRRFARDKRVTLYSQEIAALNLLMELHDAQMDVITVKDMSNALDFIKKEVRHGRAERIIEDAPA